MSAMTPVDEIGQILEEGGYRRLSVPLRIAGLSFDLPAAFLGTIPSPDLILIADTAFESDERILSKVEGIARALDVVRSKRPVTAVLAGPRPRTTIIDALAKVCRVLPIGTALDAMPAATLRTWLAVLLPLSLPAPSQELADPLGQMSTNIKDLHPSVAGLIPFATQGADVVQEKFHGILREQLADAEESALE